MKTATAGNANETIPRFGPEGGDARFCTTRWTVVLGAGGDGPERDAAMEQFCRTYWYPLYAFVRRRGEAAEDARDLVQGFFARMLEQGWLGEVERRETRFSTLLRTIFERFLMNQHRRATAEKRGGGDKPLSFDLAQAEQWFGAEPSTDETPERIYERRWALAVLDAAMAHLREEYRATGRSRHFDTLSPFLSRKPAPEEYEAVAATMGLKMGAIAVAVHRLRVQFRGFVRAEVAAGLNDPAHIDEEMRHLGAAL